MAGPYWEIVSACWFAFWVFWTISTRRLGPPKRKAPLAFTILNTALLYLGFVLVLVGRLDVAPLSVRFAKGVVLVDVVGTALVVAGVAFSIWARRALGANWSGVVRIIQGQRLVRTGPYAFVRNPIYTGIALAALGTALVGGTVGGLIGFALIVVSLWQKGRVEERFLLAEFGEEYSAYQRDVKFLIPFIF